MLTLAMISFAALSWLLALTVDPGNGIAGKGLAIFSYGVTALAAARLVEQMVALFIGGPGEKTGHSERLHTIVGVVLYIAALLSWLHYAFGLDVSGLLATSAVVTLVIGLALQATLGNLFSGLSLELERPLRVGDFIQRGAIEGRVTALKWRSIFIRTNSNTRIVLPNNGLTTDFFEVIPKGDPCRQIVTFSVDSEVPPMDVLAVAEDVLRSGLPKILAEPSPSALLLGVDPQAGSLRYCARYYTDDWWDRSTTSSNLHVRLWYALSRKGIAMAAATPMILKEGEDAREDLSTPNRLPDTARSHSAEANLEALGQRRRYGPNEEITLDGGAAIVISGSAREEQRQTEKDEQARLDMLLETQADPKAAVLMATQLLNPIAEQSALLLGPYAYELATEYARRTDDPRMLYLAMATHIGKEGDRAAFLARAPRQTTRRLNAGAFVGFGRALGITPAIDRGMTSNRRCELLHLPQAAVRTALEAGLLPTADLVQRDADLANLDEAKLAGLLRRGQAV